MKNLPTDAIANDLAKSSVFFKSQPSAQSMPNVSKATEKSAQNLEAPGIESSSKPNAQVTNDDSTLSRNHAITHSDSQDGGQQTTHNLDDIRKAVKQLGKELSTHRFTSAEKKALADIVYTHTQQGIRTSENEITRIGVNWLLQDYRQHGAHSVLAQLLEKLHA